MESGIGQGWAHKDIPVRNYTPLLSRSKCTQIYIINYTPGDGFGPPPAHE
jgi:hypothetical protein